MNLTDAVLHYRRYLKRRNYSGHTRRNYLNRLQHFLVWLSVPVESAGPTHIKHFIDVLLDKRLGPQTVNGHLIVIRSFYRYLKEEEGLEIDNPVVSGLSLRLPKPLPRYLQESEVNGFFAVITKQRDLAMFMLMLRCGLRVEEVANLTLDVVDHRRNQIMVRSGKGAKDRLVYLNEDVAEALAEYLQNRPQTDERRVFLVEKGIYTGKPLSVRGIQKRAEHYSEKSGIHVSCHQLRHTMATQLLNAGADIVTIQYLLGHSRIKTTMRYALLSNRKARRDYYEAMDRIIAQSGRIVTWGMRC
ncbi:MAG: tyrosine-type recombinase/integrase [Desulfobacterales bacterium]|nr:tyrosine-type recombinase/integrase [Desulfobacterales bacterium]